MRFFVLALGLIATMASARVAVAQPAVEACVASFSDGQVQQKRGKLADAIRIYAECATPTCPAAVREDCTRKRAEVERALPTVVIAVRDASGKDVASKVTVDGVIFDTSAGSARPIDPGPHTIAFGPAGAKPREEKVTIVEGEKSRSIVLTWSDAIPPVPEDKKPPTEEPKREQPPAKEESRSVGPYIVGGVGAVAIIAGIGIYVLSRNEADKGQQLRQEANTARAAGDTQKAENADNAAESRFSAADNDKSVALVVGVAGVLLLGGAALWFVVDTPKKRTALMPSLGPGYAGASFGRSF